MHPQVTKVVAYANRHVPRYMGLDQLDSFPVVSKREILADLPAFLSEELGTEKIKLAAFLASETRSRTSKSESIYSQSIIVEETSGTSGLPFRIPKTLGERAACSMGIWKHRKEIDADASIRTFYPFVHAPAGFNHAIPPGVCTPENIDALYHDLIKRGIRWVHGNPGILKEHATMISSSIVQQSGIRFAESSGFHLDHEARQFIGEKLGVTIVDQYGCREVWVIGNRVRSEEFKINHDNVQVEIMDNAGQPIYSPGVRGSIVVTGLHQRLLPFIRYATGDLGAWASGEIGTGLILANERSNELLQLKNNEVSGCDFFRLMLVQVYRRIGFVRMRFIQIRQVADGTFTIITDRISKAEELRTALERQCNGSRLFAGPVNFESRMLDEPELLVELDKKPCLFLREEPRRVAGR